MRTSFTLFLSCIIGALYSQITITPSSGCAGTTFTITMTGIQPFSASSQCGNISGGLYSGGSSPVLDATNFSTASTTMTATLTIPANFTGSLYDFSFTVPCRGTRSCSDCFTVLPLPSNVTLTPGGNQHLCLGDTISLTCQAANATTYQWTRNGNDIVGATSSTYDATFSGSYLCVAGNSCGNVTSSNSDSITASQPPPTPTITLNGGILQTAFSASYSYQWYLNGSALPNAFANTFTPTQGGDYVVVVDDGTCSSASAPFVFTGIFDNEDGISFDVYPNPAKSSLLISGNFSQAFVYRLIDARGRELLRGSSNQNRTNIDVFGFSAGIYVLVLETPEGILNKKIRIE